jgi:two-component system sensor histidine kinase UhpB
VKTKKTICLFFLILITGISRCYAQGHEKIDSLTKVLINATDDSNKVNAQNEMCRQLYQRGDYAQALGYAESSIKLSKQIRFKKGESKAYLDAGNIFWLKADYTTAMNYYTQSLKVSEEIQNKKGVIGALLGIGNIFRMQSNYSRAIINYKKALALSTEINELRNIAYSSNEIGIVYAQEGNYSEALKYKLQALRVSQQSGERDIIIGVYNDIAGIYQLQGNYSEALKNHFASLKLAKESENKTAIASSYSNIGIVYSKLGNYNEALNNYLTSLKMFKEVGGKYGMAAAYGNIGTIYQIQNNNYTALQNYLLARRIHEQIGNKEGIANSAVNIGLVYKALHNYKASIKYLTDGLFISKEIGDKSTIVTCYSALAEIEGIVGNYSKAWNYSKMYSIYRDSLFNEVSTKQMNEMKLKYETEKKDNIIELLNKDQSVQKVEISKQKIINNIFIWSLVLLIGIFYLVYKTFRTRQQLQLHALRNKIASDLHDDVGSTLSSISIFSEIAKQQSKEVMPMLEQISESSRTMLDAMSDIIWTINSDNDVFENIVLRMKNFAFELLGAKKMDFTFNADDNVSKIKLSMIVRKNIYLIFKEATNNMAKYADSKTALFSVSMERESLTMIIRDNGIGFDVNTESLGNGLKNMKKRALEIGANLLIESEAGEGTTLKLILNVS